jgi:hypothetical protein
MKMKEWGCWFEGRGDKEALLQGKKTETYAKWWGKKKRKTKKKKGKKKVMTTEMLMCGWWWWQ